MVKRNNKKNTDPAIPKNKIQYAKLIKKGAFLNKEGDHINAIKFLNAAFAYDQSNPQLLTLLSGSLFKIGNKQAAMTVMARALELNPDDANNMVTLGNAAQSMGFLELALKFHEQHIRLAPSDYVGYNNYATILRELGQFEEAINLLQDVLPIFPKEPALWNTLGSIVSFRDGPAAAQLFFEESIKIDPDNINALYNIAPSYYSTGEVEKAEESVRKVLEIDPDAKQPNLYLSTLLLREKRLEEGWEKYQWRFEGDKIKNTINFNKLPYWNGESLKGKKLFIFSEQGIGDEILFTWLMPELIKEADKVGIACNERLVSLFKDSFPKCQVGLQQNMVSQAHDIMYMSFPDFDLTEYDYQIVAGDVAKYKWEDYNDIKPNGDPILSPNNDLVKSWKKKVDALPKKLSVGVAWRSGITLANRSRNYTDLVTWAPLLRNENVNYINVQYGDCQDELDELEKETGIKIHNFEDLDLKDDFNGTTAMMTSLDLVLGPASAPTMQSSLAGVNTWFFCSDIPFWSFGDEYPVWRQNARVLHKNNNDPWKEFMIEKGKEFDEWCKKRLK